MRRSMQQDKKGEAFMKKIKFGAVNRIYSLRSFSKLFTCTRMFNVIQL